MFHRCLDRVLLFSAEDVRSDRPDFRFPFHEHRWVFYTLIAAVLLVTLAAVGFGPLTSRAIRQRDAVAALERLHCSVLYDYDPPGPWPKTSWKKPGRPRGPEWLRSIVGAHFFDRAVTVRLDAATADQAVPWLRQLPHLTQVYVNGGAACGLTTPDENELPAVEYLRRELPTTKVDLTGPIMIVG